jgi:hypothetical protein
VLEIDPMPGADIPPPNANLVLWRASVMAFITVCGRRKAEKFLRVMAEQLAAEENLSSVFQIRPNSEHLNVRQARREAAELLRRYLPLFLASLRK